jgi:hypothetical protein
VAPAFERGESEGFDAMARFQLRCVVSDCEGLLDQIDELLVEFRMGAILDDETLALAGAPQLRLDPQDERIRIALVLHSNLKRRGDLWMSTRSAAMIAYSPTSYWDTVATGKSNGYGLNSGAFSATGLTTTQLQSGTLPPGFDPKVWGRRRAHIRSSRGCHSHLLKVQFARQFEIRLGCLAKKIVDPAPF